VSRRESCKHERAVGRRSDFAGFLHHKYGTDEFYLSLLGLVSAHGARRRCCTELFLAIESI
jgi:hypothetical protein